MAPELSLRVVISVGYLGPTLLWPYWPSETVHGLAAFRCWAEAVERPMKAGKKWGDPLCLHTFSARFYARNYLQMIMGEDPDLREAHTAYKTEVDVLTPVWEAALRLRQAHQSGEHGGECQPPAGSIPEFVERLREAGRAEASAVRALRRYVARVEQPHGLAAQRRRTTGPTWPPLARRQANRNVPE